MTTRLPTDTVCDSESARLLPWFVTGRLTADDGARVSRHLEDCAICRADYEDLRALRTAIRDDGPVEYAPQAGLAKTLARIDELARGDSEPTAGSAPRPVPARRFHMTRWLTAAVVVQAIGLGVLGGALMARSSGVAPRAPYQTLSESPPDPSAPVIRAVFSAPMTLGQLNTLLTAHRLLIVAGPTDAGVFTLGASDPAFDVGRLKSSLAALRADPHVLFAEPIESSARKSP